MPRTVRRTLVVLLFVLVVPAASGLELHPVLTDDALPGWEVKRGDPDAWFVADGVLHCTGEGGGWIGTKADYTDFILDFEYNLSPGGNSGVFFRAPRRGNPAFKGFEVQLLDDDAPKHRHLKPTQHCGALYGMVAPAAKASRPAGQWNHMRIRVNQDLIVVVLNGQVVINVRAASHPFINERAARGAIGFQNHHSPIRFRNIKLADLAADRAERAKWFTDAKFGMFIHWGVYSVIGKGEWVMKVARIPSPEYEKVVPKFNPVQFNAADWVALAKRAGQKYIVITSKHHDGFCMYDSKFTDYDIVDATDYKHDPMKDLARECARQGLKFGFYYSIGDWHHPDYEPIPDWDKQNRAGKQPDFDRYLAYVADQARELCTNYGPLACFWWDGLWSHTGDDDRLKFLRINDTIRALQPRILINNRSGLPEDFSTPEQHIPPTGLTRADGSPVLWENCVTLTTGHGSFPPTAWWGYDKYETQFKTPEFVVRMLVDVVSKGGNLLLNVGPTPEGTIRPEEAAVLEAVGRWMKTHGEAIYGTTASPFRRLPFYGRATVKKDMLYLSVFLWPTDGRLVIPNIENEARSARLLGVPDTKLRIERSGDDLVIHLPADPPDPVASVVAVKLDGPPRVRPLVIEPAANGAIHLPAVLADLHGSHGQRIRFETTNGRLHIGHWERPADFVSWEFTTDKAGPYEVTLHYAAADTDPSQKRSVNILVLPIRKGAPGRIDNIQIAEIQARDLHKLAKDHAALKVEIAGTGDEARFASRAVGTLTLPAGKAILFIYPTEIPKGARLMNLRAVTLQPAVQHTEGR